MTNNNSCKIKVSLLIEASARHVPPKASGQRTTNKKRVKREKRPFGKEKVKTNLKDLICCIVVSRFCGLLFFKNAGEMNEERRRKNDK